MHHHRLLPSAALIPLLLSGCVVIPVGDLLKGPALEEQVLIAGRGLFSKDKIAILDVDGVITGGESLGLFGSSPNTVSEVKARLVRIKNDPSVQGVVLRISSPGGEVTACDSIHHEIGEFKKATGVPVVAIVLDEAASGGYYIASAADAIIAQPTAIVGSIGVIMQTFDISGLFGKVGVATAAIKSAPMKDILSPFRGRTDEEKAVLQKVIDGMYGRFLDVVSARPGAPPREELQKVADGRIFTASDALALRLVDKIGYVADAIEEVRTRAKIGRKPEVIRYTRIARSGANIYSMADPSRREAGAEGGGISLQLRADALPRSRFLYLWQPGVE